MTLSFSKENIEKRFFAYKIWASLLENKLVQDSTHLEYLNLCRLKLGKVWEMNDSVKFQKIHTIREDKTDRWKIGNLIHFVMNNRTPNRFQFTPIVKVQSIQKIEIIWDKPFQMDYHSGSTIKINDRFVVVKIEGKAIGRPLVSNLSKHDGFDSINDFFEWFNEDFEGKIIHWTDYRY